MRGTGGDERERATTLITTTIMTTITQVVVAWRTR
jgi:hypothetical protein